MISSHKELLRKLEDIEKNMMSNSRLLLKRFASSSGHLRRSGRKLGLKQKKSPLLMEKGKAGGRESRSETGTYKMVGVPQPYAITASKKRRGKTDWRD
jgi:hypothetical protein